MIHVSVLCDRDTLNLHLYFFLQMHIAVNLQSLNIHNLFEYSILEEFDIPRIKIP